MNPQKISAALVLAVCASTCVAQTEEAESRMQRPPDDTQKSLETFFCTMAPVQAKAAEASLEATTKYAERPEVAERVATFKRNLFDALKKRGFTTEQALQIALAAPLPSLR